MSGACRCREYWAKEIFGIESTKLSAATLDPRPDSETLVNALPWSNAVHVRRPGSLIRILDLGVWGAGVS